jgi:hypothetical protein
MMMFLLVYVDDVKIACSSSKSTSKLLQALKDNFALKHLGPLHYFLGIEFQHTPEGYLSQKKYTTDLLHRAGMTNCKPVTTPMASSAKLSTQDGDPLGVHDTTMYRSIVGVDSSRHLFCH